MRVANRANLSEEEISAIEGQLPGFGTLLDLFAWGRLQEPPVDLASAVTQDEFTHDLILRWRGGFYLVVGAT